MKAPLKWYWRVGITLFVTCVSATLVFVYLADPVMMWAIRCDWSFGGLLPRGWAFVIEIAAQIVLYSSIPMAICIGLYHRLTFGGYKSGKTYCGACDSILENLEEPRCPTCGEAI